VRLLNPACPTNPDCWWTHGPAVMMYCVHAGFVCVLSFRGDAAVKVRGPSEGAGGAEALQIAPAARLALLTLALCGACRTFDFGGDEDSALDAAQAADAAAARRNATGCPPLLCKVLLAGRPGSEGPLA
jgi:hypothetical protein